MTEITVGKYRVRSDNYNLWIDEEITNKKGNTTTKRVAGYCSNYTQLLKSFMDNGFRNSDARNVKELLRDINTVRAELLEIIGGLK